MVNVALVGFMGSGKTSAGRILAERLHYRFVDTDRLVEEKTGQSIPDIFKSEGEAGFRKIESQVLEEVLGGRRSVVSCGGGVVLLERNRVLLRESSVVVYLKTSPAEIYRRIGTTGKSRPLLDVEDPVAQINRLVEEREPLYQDVAHITVTTDGKNLQEVAEILVRELKMRGNLS